MVASGTGPPSHDPSPGVAHAQPHLRPAAVGRARAGRGLRLRPGFLRRWRKSEGGCFFLPFLAVGLAIFTFGALGTWGPYKESLRANGDPRFFLVAMAFGATFFLVALRMLQIQLTGVKSEERRMRSKGDRKHPWTTDYPWKPEGMAPD